METTGELNKLCQFKMIAQMSDTLTFALRYPPATVTDSSAAVDVSSPAKWTDLVQSKH